jgi:hypothetical protein
MSLTQPSKMPEAAFAEGMTLLERELATLRRILEA